MPARGGSRGWGTWTHPDLVVSADPRRRRSRSEPPRLHAIEVETAEGFDLKSVYQAHAQGRGANYCWVIGAFAAGVTDYEWDRALWTAKELGVGIVELRDLGRLEHGGPIFTQSSRLPEKTQAPVH